VDLRLPEAVGNLREAVADLLSQAKSGGTVDERVDLPEVMALIVSLCQGALAGGWDERLRSRTLAVVFAGLRSGFQRP
jgi:hypothetical protein